MSTNKFEQKIKSIFASDQKEKLITQDGRRNLYFDRNRKHFIKFILDVKTTCSTIQNQHKEEINRKLKELYGNNVNTDNFSFLIVELMANKFEGKNAFIDLKLNIYDTSIFNILQNTQLMLCYLPINLHNNYLKKNSKNSIKTETDCAENDFEIWNFPFEKKEKKDKKLEIYLPKTIIHYYNSNKKAFSKEKIRISEIDIYIYAKLDMQILIKDIVSINNSQKENIGIENIYKNYVIYGEKPKFCIEIITVNKERFLIGRNTYEHFVTLTKALESASINYKNQYMNNSLNNRIMEENNNILYTHKVIAQSCSTINDLVVNKEKRKILFKDFQEKNLADIVNNIMEFKINWKKGKYAESINNIEMILKIINEKMGKEELDKYQKIINKDIIEKINEINNNIKKICEENNNNNEIKDENVINKLNQTIDINILDNLYCQIKEEYLSKYYEENNLINDRNYGNFIINKNNCKILENTKLLLGHYFTNIFKIKKDEDFLYLGGGEVEEIIKDFNNELNMKKKFVRTVLKC